MIWLQFWFKCPFLNVVNALPCFTVYKKWRHSKWHPRAAKNNQHHTLCTINNSHRGQLLCSATWLQEMATIMVTSAIIWSWSSFLWHSTAQKITCCFKLAWACVPGSTQSHDKNRALDLGRNGARTDEYKAGLPLGLLHQEVRKIYAILPSWHQTDVAVESSPFSILHRPLICGWECIERTNWMITREVNPTTLMIGLVEKNERRSQKASASSNLRPETHSPVCRPQTALFSRSLKNYLQHAPWMGWTEPS